METFHAKFKIINAYRGSSTIWFELIDEDGKHHKMSSLSLERYRKFYNKTIEDDIEGEWQIIKRRGCETVYPAKVPTIYYEGWNLYGIPPKCCEKFMCYKHIHSNVKVEGWDYSPIHYKGESYEIPEYWYKLHLVCNICKRKIPYK